MALRRRDLVLLAVFLTLALALVYTFRYMSAQNDHGTEAAAGHRIVIVPPSGNLSANYRNTLVQSVEGIVGELSFLTGGKVSSSMIRVATPENISSSLSWQWDGDSFIVFTKGVENRVIVFFKNKTVILEYNSSRGLAAVSDRLLVELAGDLVLGTDSKREYLVLVHPVRGNRVGIVWVGGLSLEQVKGVPVTYPGGKLSQKDLIEMISGVGVGW